MALQNPQHPIGRHETRQNQRERVAQTVLIATASRRELEDLCSRHSIPFLRRPTPSLRQALRQKLLANRF